MSQGFDDSSARTKRRLLTSSIAIAGTAALASQTSLTFAKDDRKKNTKDSPRDDFRKSNPGRAPYTTPFVVPLPIPPIKEPVSSLSPSPTKSAGKDEAGRLPHQAWDRFPPKKYYEIRVREENHSFHPDLPTQKIWGYDGMLPGPTFVARYRQPILVRIENDLPSNHIGFGSPEISTHLHNGHTPSESDGFPADYYSREKYGPTLTRAGKYKDHHYPNIYSNLTEFPDTDGDTFNALGTLWYHDHRMEFTAPNVYRGLAGFYLMFDELDSGDEKDPNPNALRLPSGIGKYDIPLLFQDKSFDSSGYLYFNQFDTEGAVGDKFCVNGKIQPYFEVERRKYRFRMLNGSALRFYEFYIVHNNVDQKFWHIANDGNLLPAPVETSKVRLAVAERGDIIVDFSKYPIGSQLYIVNRLEHLDGRGPTGNLLSPGIQIMRFDVKRDPAYPDTSRIPPALRQLRPISLTKVKRVRRWEFDRENDLWTVNGKLFDETKPAAIIKRGDDEIWELQGKGSWSHPVHIHFEEARILSRNGVPPPPHERGRKDVFELRPGEVVRILICFEDFVGKYIMHCHNTIHEDHHMMVRFDVVP
jgi:FtsP/CotA-like multicopper oxidase with cupredoxin domain